MRNPGIILAFVCLCLCSCDQFKKPETLAKEEAWSVFKEKLKAPSTAKLVDANAVEVNNNADRLKYYTEADSNIIRLNIMLDMESHGVDITKDEVNLNMIQTLDPEISVGLQLAYKHKVSKKDMLKAISDGITHAKAKRAEAFKNNDKTIKAYYVDIQYDSENSYGAMLRGKALCIVVSVFTGVYHVVEVNGVVN